MTNTGRVPAVLPVMYIVLAMIDTSSFSVIPGLAASSPAWYPAAAEATARRTRSISAGLFTIRSAWMSGLASRGSGSLASRSRAVAMNCGTFMMLPGPYSTPTAPGATPSFARCPATSPGNDSMSV